MWDGMELDGIRWDKMKWNGDEKGQDDETRHDWMEQGGT